MSCCSHLLSVRAASVVIDAVEVAEVIKKISGLPVNAAVPPLNDKFLVQSAAMDSLEEISSEKTNDVITRLTQLVRKLCHESIF